MKANIVCIFVDLTKASDTVDHEIVLDKLDRYGIRGHIYNFIRLCYSDKHQYAVINGAGSPRDLFLEYYFCNVH